MGTRNAGRGGQGGRGAWRALLFAAFGLLPSAFAPAAAQDAARLFLDQRQQARAAEVMGRLGPRVAPRPPVRLGGVDVVESQFLAVQAERQAALDRFMAAERAKADSLIEAARLANLSWQKVEPSGQGVFLEQYRDAYWRASDPQRGLAVDTTATPELRGRLQALFGRPTRNAEAAREVGYGGSEFVQFEYWFIVNDSIPVLVLDLDGPFGKGLLLAGDESQARYLPRLKADLSARLSRAGGPVPFVDYYHAYDRRAWYRVGYNGAEFYVREVGQPPGWSRRPDVDRWMIHR